MKSREKYYKVLWMCIKRRNEIRKRVGYRVNGYGKKVNGLNIKIASCRQAIKIIDERNSRLGGIVKQVNEYFDVKIECVRMDEKHKLARNVYYKYGMEVLGIEGSKIAQYIGRPKQSAQRSRIGFTRRFYSQIDNKEQYHKFLNYIKDNDLPQQNKNKRG